VKKPRNLILLDPSEVQVPEGRFRKEFDQHELQLLIKSILELGQIQPVVITREGELVVGERRLRACKHLGREIEAVYIDEVDELMLREMEFHENIYREQYTPQERVLAKEALHAIKQKQFGDPTDPSSLRYGEGWRQEDTAKMLGQSQALLSEELIMAKILPHSPEMQKAKTLTDMKKVMKKLKKEAQWHVQAEKAESLAAVEEKRMPGERPSLTREQLLKGKVSAWDKRLIVADAMEMLHKKELYLGPPGLVFFDPPWGVGLHEKVEDGVLQGISYEDTKEKFKAEFPVYARLLYEAMRPDSHLYVFFGIVHHRFVYFHLARAGFEVNRRPIIWAKPGIKSTRQPEKWPGASYEPIAFARKGSRDLVEKIGDSITDVKALTPEQKKGHPSAKPWQLYDNLLKRSCYPGDVVLDPMYGTGPAFVACEMNPKLRPMWYGWENVIGNRQKSLLNLLQAVGAAKGE